MLTSFFKRSNKLDDIQPLNIKSEFIKHTLCSVGRLAKNYLYEIIYCATSFYFLNFVIMINVGIRKRTKNVQTISLS